MLLTISTTNEPADDLGYLLHKHPNRCQSFELSFGQAHVFWPEVSQASSSCCLALEVDSVGLVRGKNRHMVSQEHYVNDRPFVVSSFMSVAISQVFGTAMSGRCEKRKELVGRAIPLTAKLDVLNVRGDDGFVNRIFEPLGYTVTSTPVPLDESIPEFGVSTYLSLTLEGTVRLSELLAHLYVLIPVFDKEKHYYVGPDEVEKLLVKGAGWLAGHPEKRSITRRYLNRQKSLWSEALERLDIDVTIEGETDDNNEAEAAPVEAVASLNDQRHGAVIAAIRAAGAKNVLDLGCGEGKLLKSLFADRQFERIVGVDVSHRSLEIAARRLRLERLPENQAGRIELLHGSLTYRDKRLEGFDAAAVVEVIEHLDPPRLKAFERVLFECARPGTVVLTTPNQEYNSKWESLPAGEMRHSDHRFEWTRAEFRAWADRISSEFGYSVRYMDIGPVDEQLGAPTQMAIFTRSGSVANEIGSPEGTAADGGADS